MASARGGVKLETLEPRWPLIIVAAPGPSLTEEVAEVCRPYPCIAIKQAALPGRMPWANVCYCCNSWQWQQWGGLPQFQGERWSLHHRLDRKNWVADEYGLRLVRGEGIRAERFSTDPSVINYGLCSGFVGLGFAIHWLRRPGKILMVGFDFRSIKGRDYWNGLHPQGRSRQFHSYMRSFEAASEHLPPGVQIFNCTPGSALKCFPFADLQEAFKV